MLCLPLVGDRMAVEGENPRHSREWGFAPGEEERRKIAMKDFRLTRRSGRRSAAAACIGAGLAITILAAIVAWWMPSLLGQGSFALGSLIIPASADALVVYALLLCGIGALIASFPRRSAIAKTSVYLDAENQVHTARQVELFLSLLDGELHGRRADRFYYTDTSRNANVKAYRDSLLRGGFLLIDVPQKARAKRKAHAKRGVQEYTHVIDAVDVELALHAYERALLGPAHQRVILVAADKDYFALMRRLKLQGHKVSVWARSPDHVFRAICDALGIPVRDLAEEELKVAHTQAPGSSAVTAPLFAVGNAALPTNLAPATSEATKQAAVSGAVTLSTLVRAFELTLQIAQHTETTASSSGGTRKERFNLFKTRLGGADTNILRRLGYDGKYKGADRFDYWLTHLDGLQVLRFDSRERVPQAVTADFVQAADNLYTFLQAIAATARGAVPAEAGIVRFESLCDALAQPPSAGQTDQTPGLRRLVASDNKRRVGHMYYFCRCARALGLLDFDDGDAQPVGIRPTM
jgi:NYN domain